MHQGNVDFELMGEEVLIDYDVDEGKKDANQGGAKRVNHNCFTHKVGEGDLSRGEKEAVKENKIEYLDSGLFLH